MSDCVSCVDCGVYSPDTNASYTLISSTGWRLTRVKLADGSIEAEWRCPTCWRRRKDTSGERTADQGPLLTEMLAGQHRR